MSSAFNDLMLGQARWLSFIKKIKPYFSRKRARACHTVAVRCLVRVEQKFDTIKVNVVQQQGEREGKMLKHLRLWTVKLKEISINFTLSWSKRRAESKSCDSMWEKSSHHTTKNGVKCRIKKELPNRILEYYILLQKKEIETESRQRIWVWFYWMFDMILWTTTKRMRETWQSSSHIKITILSWLVITQLLLL